jgi:AcrR family transcriptional regulator
MTKSAEPHFTSNSTATRADAVKNRALLLTTARELFEHCGVQNVSMSQIAETAGVGKGTLYRHFDNKTDLCYALLDTEQRNLQESTFDRLRLQGDPLTDLTWFLDQVIQFVIRNDELLHGGIESRIVSPLAFPAHNWWRLTIRGLLQRLNLGGDLDYLTDVLYVMVNVDTIHYQLHRHGFDYERIRDGVRETFARLQR